MAWTEAVPFGTAGNVVPGTADELYAFMRAYINRATVYPNTQYWQGRVVSRSVREWYRGLSYHERVSLWV